LFSHNCYFFNISVLGQSLMFVPRCLVRRNTIFANSDAQKKWAN